MPYSKLIYAAIAGGCQNCIENSGVYGFIGGGGNNCIYQPSSVVQQYNVIAGGYNNTVCASYNAILGGQNNDDSNLPGVMIVGNNITAVAPNSLHVNGIWANGLPVYAGGPAITPVGRMFILAPGTPAPGWAQGQIWIA